MEWWLCSMENNGCFGRDRVYLVLSKLAGESNESMAACMGVIRAGLAESCSSYHNTMGSAPVYSDSGPSGHATNQYAFQVHLDSLVGKAPDHESWSPRTLGYQLEQESAVCRPESSTNISLEWQTPLLASNFESVQSHATKCKCAATASEQTMLKQHGGKHLIRLITLTGKREHAPCCEAFVLKALLLTKTITKRLMPCT
ncbi:hypothetical protein SERLA73DRAFT_161679 [Serpula lacrymans var. lacrymans S7.3]|uniref:Uncharacterized protein n=1 Tax=Serpula lacrymans var. lacrymans (strain S7.3) TaxID=936435 RepID=F8Q4R5_SERL3|nr:hypothetical protein SERLA73DRAFT_161679 [Serpula lacrymans var. lacrymans S7.3]